MMTDEAVQMILAMLFGLVVGAILGTLVTHGFRPPVDEDLIRIQKQRNAWAQYTEANR
jgi:hypothetical protein